MSIPLHRRLRQGDVIFTKLFTNAMEDKYEWRIHLSLAICRRHRYHGRDAVGPTADAEVLFCIGLRNLKRKY